MGAWLMYAMRPRCRSGRPPSTFKLPCVGAESPASRRRRVDFPAPFSPRITVEDPEAIVSVRLRTAAKVPKSFETPWSSAAGMECSFKEVDADYRKNWWPDVGVARGLTERGAGQGRQGLQSLAREQQWMKQVGQRQVGGSLVQARISTRISPVGRWRGRLRRAHKCR